MLYFEEKLLPVEEEGDENPKPGSPQVLQQQLPVALLETNLPAEGEVEAEQRVANVHKDGVHPCLHPNRSVLTQNKEALLKKAFNYDKLKIK